MASERALETVTSAVSILTHRFQQLAAHNNPPPEDPDAVPGEDAEEDMYLTRAVSLLRGCAASGMKDHLESALAAVSEESPVYDRAQLYIQVGNLLHAEVTYKYMVRTAKILRKCVEASSLPEARKEGLLAMHPPTCTGEMPDRIATMVMHIATLDAAL